MNLSLRLLVLVGIAVLVLAVIARPHSAGARSTRVNLVEQIADYRTQTWSWQRLTGSPRTPTSYSERRRADTTYRAWVRDLWRRRSVAAARRAAHPPHRAAIPE